MPEDIIIFYDSIALRNIVNRELCDKIGFWKLAVEVGNSSVGCSRWYCFLMELLAVKLPDWASKKITAMKQKKTYLR